MERKVTCFLFRALKIVLVTTWQGSERQGTHISYIYSVNSVLRAPRAIPAASSLAGF